MAAYRTVLGIPAARRVLLLGTLIRIPIWSGAVILTLHVVTHLHRNYAAAGLLAGVATAAAMVSGPWRGRRLDRIGLRATVGPALAVQAVCWSIAPFVGYWALLVLATVADLFLVPTFSVVRQSLMANVPDVHRRTALSIDSVSTEISFMIGPVLGVALATLLPTPWALALSQFTAVAGGILLWVVDPPLRSEPEPSGGAASAASDAPPDRSRWLSLPVLTVLAMCVATTVVLTGSDLGIVAALRHLHHQSWIGWVLAVWGIGSAIGGIVYGALHRSLPVTGLLALLALGTLPVLLAPDAITLGVLLFVAGLFCAPTITASVEAISHAVDERARGEALGWHGSALTAGSALGAPLAGSLIDQFGWRGGFLGPALLALALAVIGALVLRRTPVATAADRVPVPTT